MATVTLHPGAVTVTSGTTVNPGSGVTGSPPQWADGSDATYAIVQRTFSGNDHAKTSSDAAVPGVFVSVVANARLSATGPSTVGVNVDLADPSDSSVFAYGSFEVPPDGVIRDFSLLLTSDNPPDWVSVPTLTTDVAIPFPFGASATIYELSFTVTTVDLTKPATRLFPRDDNRGLGSPRLYPPPKSGRLVGGYH